MVRTASQTFKMVSMKLNLLPVLIPLLCLLLGRCYASLPTEIYWHSKLPNTPIPQELQKLLQPDMGEKFPFWDMGFKSLPPFKSNVVDHISKKTYEYNNPSKLLTGTYMYSKPVERSKETYMYNKLSKLSKETYMYGQPSESLKEIYMYSRPLESSKETYIYSRPLESSKETYMYSKPSELLKETYMYRQPSESSKETYMYSKPLESSKKTYMYNQPSESLKETYMYSKPSKSSRETYMYSQPSESSRETYMYSQPSESSKETYMYSQPSESSKETYKNTQRSKLSKETYMYSQPSESSKETYMYSQPSESSKETYMYSQPSESSKKIYMYSQPSESSKETYMYSQPLESSGETYMYSQLSKSSGETYMYSQPSESSKETYMYVQPSESSRKTYMYSQSSKLPEDGYIYSQPFKPYDGQAFIKEVHEVRNKPEKHLHNSQIFLLYNDLQEGKKLRLHIKKSTNMARILPRQVAESIPFSSYKLPTILKHFSVKPESPASKIIRKTLTDCEEPGVKGEDKTCVTSLESLIDFTIAHVGDQNVEVVYNEIEKPTMEQEYTILGVEMKGENPVVCHKLKYPYAVYYCHYIKATKVYMASLVGSDGSKAKTIVVCHSDTSTFNPKNVVFLDLNIKPGEGTICHVIKSDTLVWLSTQAAM